VTQVAFPTPRTKTPSAAENTRTLAGAPPTIGGGESHYLLYLLLAGHTVYRHQAKRESTGNGLDKGRSPPHPGPLPPHGERELARFPWVGENGA
jgi:hypothetical protein